MKIIVGSDDAGYDYKEVLVADLRAVLGDDAVVDVGVDSTGHTPYPSIALTSARRVASGEFDRALLICGTGLGMAIAANKVSGVRAVTAHDSYSVERGVLSNDAQVLCLGQRVVGLELARRLVREWLNYSFDDASASAPKVALISDYEHSAAVRAGSGS